MENSDSKSTQTPDKILYQLILKDFEASKRTYGKVALLNKQALMINYTCIRRIMSKYHLACILLKPKFKCRLQPCGTVKNVLKCDFSSEKSLQKIYLDITCLKVTKPSMYDEIFMQRGNYRL